MIKYCSAVIMISLLMVACPSDPNSDTQSDNPSYDCRMSAYQCAEGFTCEPIGSGEFTCVRSSGTAPTGGSVAPGGNNPGGGGNVSGVESPSAGTPSGGIDGGIYGGIYGGTTAGYDPEPEDCRTYGCSYNEICTSDDYGGYFCNELYQCAYDNGGCGDPDYMLCIDEVEGTVSCVDIQECDYDNGGCGDPNRYFCVERVGEPPSCEEIFYAEAPPLLGTFSEMFTMQGGSNIENCHLVYMPTVYGLADTSGGCETCSYAWDITFNLVHSSCDTEGITRSFDMPMGVDMVSRQVMLKVNGTWGVFGGAGTQVAVSNKYATLSVFEESPYAGVHARTQFIGLTWENASVSCGDAYCDYGDFYCSEDCLSGQTPASGYRFRIYGFSPSRGDYQHCYALTQLSARNQAPSSGCSNCSEAWNFRERYLLSNCGPWAHPVGTTKRNDIGSKDRNRMVFYHSDREEWLTVSPQYSEYRSEYNSLLSSWDSVGYEDIDRDGRRDSNEPSRSRSQLIVIHHQ